MGVGAVIIVSDALAIDSVVRVGEFNTTCTPEAIGVVHDGR